MTYRILVTGSRNWTDRDTVRRALLRAAADAEPGDTIVVVHGACEHGGADWLADQIALGYGWETERHPASDFGQHGTERYRARNNHMVQLGAHRCCAFADLWASGTGMCARMARSAGIPTDDYGVDTTDKTVRCRT